MKIFVSYSTPDIDIVNLFANYLRPFGDVIFWSENKVLGKEAWETIFSWIDSSDIVLVLVTGNTVTRAMSVGQEVGRAKAKGKTIIPIVSSSIPINELGFLAGTTFQAIDITNPMPAVIKIAKAIEKHSIAQKQNQDAALALAVLAFFLLLFSSK